MEKWGDPHLSCEKKDQVDREYQDKLTTFQFCLELGFDVTRKSSPCFIIHGKFNFLSFFFLFY